MRSVEVIVVGGGVVGASVAWHCAREGIAVALLEREALASGASGAAAGMLTPSGEAAASGPFLRFALSALRGFEALAAELLEQSGVDPGFVRSGTLRVARDEAEAAELRADAEALADVRTEWLGPEDARVVEPLLSERIAGALWSSEDGHVMSPLLTRAYAEAAGRRGARIETGVEVRGLRTERGRVTGVETASGAWSAPRVVLCAGSWMPLLGGSEGPAAALPIEPVRGQILSLEAPRPAPGTIVWGAGGYVVPKRDGSVVVGATEERVGFDARVTADGLHRLLDLGPRLVPALADCTFRSAWAGLRPCTVDRLPVVGPLPGVAGLAVAGGHHRTGVLLSPVTGRLVADWAAGKTLPEDAEAFSPTRFPQT